MITLIQKKERRSNMVNLVIRLVVDRLGVPVCKFRTMGIRTNIKASITIHRMVNSEYGKDSEKCRLFRISKRRKGKTIIRLINEDTARVLAVVFIRYYFE